MKIGRATLEIKSEGCIDCGSKWSSDWVAARIISVVIDGGKPINVAVHRCADCVARLKNENAVSQTPELFLQ